ncbi:hypothetical protein MKX03_026794, partial [Papaver bracteatum]
SGHGNFAQVPYHHIIDIPGVPSNTMKKIWEWKFFVMFSVFLVGLAREFIMTFCAHFLNELIFRWMEHHDENHNHHHPH